MRLKYLSFNNNNPPYNAMFFFQHIIYLMLKNHFVNYDLHNIQPDQFHDR